MGGRQNVYCIAKNPPVLPTFCGKRAQTLVRAGICREGSIQQMGLHRTLIPGFCYSERSFNSEVTGYVFIEKVRKEVRVAALKARC